MQQAALQLHLTPSSPELILAEETQSLFLLVDGRLAPQPTWAALPVNLCLVLDCSNSMRGERLFYLKDAIQHLIDELHADDTFSVVIFNDRARVAIPSQNPLEPAELKHVVTQIQASGGTEMSVGIAMGLQEISKGRAGLNHMILLTDGRTYGDDERCLELAREAQQMGISLSAFGIGHEWNEDLLELLVAHETSRAHYLTSPKMILPAFINDFKRLRRLGAREVTFNVLGRPGTHVRRAYRVEPFLRPIAVSMLKAGRWEISLGDWSEAEKYALLLEVNIDPLPEGFQHFLRLDIWLTDPHTREQRRHGVLDVGLPVVREEQAGAEGSQRVEAMIERCVIDRLQQRAWQHLQEGKVDEAAQDLQLAGKRLIDAGQEQLAHAFQREAAALRRGSPSEAGRKQIIYGTRKLLL